jgi:hypothetical protein
MNINYLNGIQQGFEADEEEEEAKGELGYAWLPVCHKHEPICLLID